MLFPLTAWVPLLAWNLRRWRQLLSAWKVLISSTDNIPSFKKFLCFLESFFFFHVAIFDESINIHQADWRDSCRLQLLAQPPPPLPSTEPARTHQRAWTQTCGWRQHYSGFQAFHKDSQSHKATGAAAPLCPGGTRKWVDTRSAQGVLSPGQGATLKEYPTHMARHRSVSFLGGKVLLLLLLPAKGPFQ